MPLLKSKDLDTITAAVAALRNLSIRKGNEVSVCPVLVSRLYVAAAAAVLRFLSSEVECCLNYAD